MNSKGIVLTALALVLILGVIAIETAIQNKQGFDLQSEARLEGIRSTNNKYDSIQNIAVNLQKTGIGKDIDQRLLLFGYDVNANKIRLAQSLPVKSNTWSSYFDFLNGVAVFVKDSNYSRVFDGIRADANTLRNASWGGDTNDVNFHYLALPQCAQYTVFYDANKLDKVQWGPGDGSPDCNQAFSISNYSYIQIDVNVNDAVGAQDFNTLDQNFADGSGPSQNANVVVNFDLSNCAKCAQNLKKTVFAYIDSAQDKSVSLSCTGSSCQSKPFTIVFGKVVSVSHAGTRVDSNISVWFDDSVEGFVLKDFNLSLLNVDQNVRQWTR